jgi:hypothetical protein
MHYKPRDIYNHGTQRNVKEQPHNTKKKQLGAKAACITEGRNNCHICKTQAKAKIFHQLKMEQ